ncbi:MAG: hypothetical protein KC964_19965, partial [Candidatus Omnitrophica bacterium]|nr:hypothetical protein [Candidatus Omnitrophota bacterium]
TGATVGGTGTVPAPSSVIRHRFLTGGPDGIDNDDYPEGYVGPTATDEDSGTGGEVILTGANRGGREEEALKGSEVFVEEVDGAILNAPSVEEAGFFACARKAAEAAASNPFSPDAMRCSPDKYVYSRTHTNWKVRRLYRHVDVDNPPGRFADDPNTAPTFSLQEKSVSFAFNDTTETETIEANGLMQDLFGGGPISYPVRNPKTTRTQTEYDNYGNVTREIDYGLVDPNAPENVSFMDDEIVTQTVYALSGSALQNWLIRLPAIQRVEDENGVFVSESRSYYDGQEFVGLPLGEVGDRGLAKREEIVLTEDPASLPPLETFAESLIDRPGDPRLPAEATLTNSRIAHDVYGNSIAVIDPLGRIEDVELLPTADAPTTAFPVEGNNGHIQIVKFDEDRHVYPVEERFVLGEGKNDLVTGAEYDPGFGVVLRMTDYNGNPTLYRYDAFARMVKKVLPGDSLDRPTEVYSYRSGDSHRNLIYDYDDTGHLMTGSPQGASPPVANRVETHEREDVSDSLTYNTVDSIVYQSGHGQDLMKLEEDEVPGRWVVQDARLYNLRGSEWAMYQPYYRS